MAEKIFRVTIKPPLYSGIENGNGSAPDQRLIRAESMNAVTDYLLEIVKADADDVAELMANGVKVEGVGA